MNDYTWQTTEAHFDNSEALMDYLNFEMDCSWSVLMVDGSYAEIMTDCGISYEVRAMGDGDSFNHRVKFKLIIE